ncbi:hypothetical protein G1C95_1108 [Bifidobacterium sp. DSM 109957]|uniref:Uncharacterized protein n=2 Tax=Bifidobacterium oedipodis TaxID=2675322 RepID=A0A7Y0EPA0_9BIFI|nr:hypothetical protein [Bifidobacterium sp. DSM 109957]
MAVNVTQRDMALDEVIQHLAELKADNELSVSELSLVNRLMSWIRGRKGYSGSMPLEVENQSEDHKPSLDGRKTPDMNNDPSSTRKPVDDPKESVCGALAVDTQTVERIFVTVMHGDPQYRKLYGVEHRADAERLFRKWLLKCVTNAYLKGAELAIKKVRETPISIPNPYAYYGGDPNDQ